MAEVEAEAHEVAVLLRARVLVAHVAHLLQRD